MLILAVTYAPTAANREEEIISGRAILMSTKKIEELQ